MICSIFLSVYLSGLFDFDSSFKPSPPLHSECYCSIFDLPAEANQLTYFLSHGQGISLPIEQFNALIKVIPDIETALAEKGQSIQRPDYSGAGASAALDEEEEEDDEVVEKKGKKNFEETSDDE